MAIIFSENSGINDVLFKDVDLRIKSWLLDYDTEKNNYDETLNAMYNVGKSSQFGEKLGSVTEFGDFEIVPEGGNAIQDDIQAGFDKLIIHEQALKKFTVTANMVEDKKIEDMKMKAEGFMRSYKRSRLALGTALLTGATQTSVTWGGKAFDTTSNDGVALFSTAHPGKKAGVANQTNLFQDAFGSDDSVLYALANHGKNLMNQSGMPMGYEFDTIILPSDAPALERLVRKIIASDHQVGNDYNDVNVSKGKWKLVVDPLWTTAGVSKKPYIITSSQANKELRGAMFYDRTPLTVRDWVDNDNYNLNFSGRFRAGAGFNDWRFAIMGGAASGSSI
jgi:hypothetical protein